MVILIDTNIVIDYLAGRASFVSAEKIIDNYCTEGKVQGFIAANAVPDIFYILRKDFSQTERRRILLDLLDILDVVSVDKHKLIESLNEEKFTDFEDCIQSKCADEIFADYIVTRNAKDFSESKTSVVSPDDFVKLMEQAQ